MSVYDKFKFPEVTIDVAKEMGLKPEEFEMAKQILGRTPNYIELGIVSAMWSEHCSYKSSKIHLKKFPTSAPWVIQGPGENAGIIEIDGDICACFKIESHNHPSYIEPYQGAATGVGGILRDVFTMGARPVAAMNSLRFGRLDNNETKHIFEGVVAGIAGYGNCFGVPTIGGEVFFHESYQKNPLVNAFALGIVKKDKIFYAKAEGEGNIIIYVGKMASPSVSLYRLTLPLTTGVLSLLQAAAIPSTAFTNCHIISGFSGFPKFKQSVIARGLAPLIATFLHASTTACIPPRKGSR